MMSTWIIPYDYDKKMAFRYDLYVETPNDFFVVFYLLDEERNPIFRIAQSKKIQLEICRNGQWNKCFQFLHCDQNASFSMHRDEWDLCGIDIRNFISDEDLDYVRRNVRYASNRDLKCRDFEHDTSTFRCCVNEPAISGHKRPAFLSLGNDKEVGGVYAGHATKETCDIDKHIVTARHAGIDFFAVRFDGGTNSMSMVQDCMDAAAREQFKICCLVTAPFLKNINSLIPYLVHPSWYSIDHKPVIFFENCSELNSEDVSLIRIDVLHATGHHAFLIGDVVALNLPSNPESHLAFDYITSLQAHVDGQSKSSTELFDLLQVRFRNTLVPLAPAAMVRMQSGDSPLFFEKSIKIAQGFATGNPRLIIVNSFDDLVKEKSSYAKNYMNALRSLTDAWR